MHTKSPQSCPTLCDLMDCSRSGSSGYGDSPGKNTGVGCHALLQGIFPNQGSNPRLLPALTGGFLTTSTAWEAHRMWTSSNSKSASLTLSSLFWEYLTTTCRLSFLLCSLKIILSLERVDTGSVCSVTQWSQYRPRWLLAASNSMSQSVLVLLPFN